MNFVQLYLIINNEATVLAFLNIQSFKGKKLKVGYRSL